LNPLAEPPSPSYVTYLYTWPFNQDNLGPEKVLAGKRLITLLESHTTIEAGTTGLKTWDASFTLGEWILSNPGKWYDFSLGLAHETDFLIFDYT